MYFFVMFATKLSVLSLYRRVFRSENFWYLIWVLRGICGVWFILSLCATLVQCRSIDSLWTESAQAKMDMRNCDDPIKLFTGITIANLVSDVPVFGLPVFFISRLHVDKKTRRMLLGIFMLGTLTCICALVRIIEQSLFVNSDAGKLEVNRSVTTLWLIPE